MVIPVIPATRMWIVAFPSMQDPFETILGNVLFFLVCAAIVQMAPIFYAR